MYEGMYVCIPFIFTLKSENVSELKESAKHRFKSCEDIFSILGSCVKISKLLNHKLYIRNFEEHWFP